MNENKKPDDNNNNKRKYSLLATIITAVIFMAVLGLLFRGSDSVETNEITYDKFVQLVEDGKIAKVELQDGLITATARKDETDDADVSETVDNTGITEEDRIWKELSDRLYGSSSGSSEIKYKVRLIGDENSLVALLEGRDIEYSKKTQEAWIEVLSSIASFLVPFLILMLFLGLMMRRSGGLMGISKSKAKTYVQTDTGITFADVAGEDEAKESLKEMVEFLNHPETFTEIGAKIPKGALLVGPPGTGKTLLAKAVAGEAHVPFFSISGSEFVEMFVGVGASRVRDLFEEARGKAPCIVFIDEIDAIGKSRDTKIGGNDEREQTLNQLLAEMDGFDSASAVIILAATNRPEILDPALLRPGRFDRRVVVEKPDLKGRVAILKVHISKVKYDETVDLNDIALATSGISGADLANIVNEAAILAVTKGRKAVCQHDLFEAVEVVLVGKEKKDRVLGKEERRIVSYHEVGHALVTALQKDAEPVQKITIVPRTMGALGYVMQVPEEEKYLNTKAELESILVTTLAGRAAEEIVFNSVTTGAANDIEKATNLARAMITRFGMSEKFGLMGLEAVENQYLDGRTYLTCSDSTAAEIDQEIMKMLKEAYEKAKTLLAENRYTLDKIAEYLIEKETITGKEFMEIFHRIRDHKEDEAGSCPSV